MSHPANERQDAPSAAGFAIDAGLVIRTPVDVAVGASPAITHTSDDEPADSDACRSQRLPVPPL